VAAMSLMLVSFGQCCNTMHSIGSELSVAPSMVRLPPQQRVAAVAIYGRKQRSGAPPWPGFLSSGDQSAWHSNRALPTPAITGYGCTMDKACRTAALELSDVVASEVSAETLRMQILEILDRVVGFDTASVQWARPGQAWVGSMRHTPHLVEAQMLDKFWHYAGEFTANELGPMLQVFAVDSEHLSRARRERLQFHRECLKPVGVSSFATRLWFAGGALHALGVTRSNGRYGSAPARLNVLFPHLSAAIHACHACQADVCASTAADYGLTSREKTVASLATKGLQNKAIATVLGISANTVRNVLASACRKVGADNRTELAFELCEPVERYSRLELLRQRRLADELRAISRTRA
jgi:DNA-binding CsgD family transcriptional regulator